MHGQDYPCRVQRPSSNASSQNRLLRLLRARKLMVASLAVGIATALAWPADPGPVTRGLIGWNVGVWLYLALVAHMMARADHGRIRRFAAAHAEGARVVLLVVVIAVIMSLAAIALELSAAKGGAGRTALPHVLFAMSTVAGSWVLVPTLFTLNYASLYYLPGGHGLTFPGAAADFQPDYADFAYFAFTIAVAAQTSDVTVTTRPMRRLVLVQSVLSFAFNTTVLALAVNLAAGLV
jgi:uncharacterized membrane protein